MARIRRVQLFMGPFKDLLGKGRDGAKVIDSTGLSTDIRISFTVNKTLLGAPNETGIVITNLSPATRKLLRQKNLAIELWGGYVDEGELKLLAKGGILGAISARKEELIETTLTIRDGWGPLLNADYGRSYDGPESIANVIKDVGKSIPGISIGRIDVAGKLSSKGRALSGNSRTVLDKLGDQYAFSWSIQDGVLQAIDDTQSSGQVYNLDSTLIDAVPVLIEHSSQLQSAIDIVAILDPRILPGDTVEVNPTVDEDLAGQYKVHSLQMTGSTHDTQWINKINCKVFL